MKKDDSNSQPMALLGGISPQQFLQEYWQKKPLLVRGAFPDFKGLLSAEELAGLACEGEVQSRLVTQARGKWRLEEGPFDETRFAKLPQKNWTLLVQGVNHHLQEAADLLQQFDFILHARLDDLMVSYAPDGGGVGPHFDSYDVFLLQGQGKRLWRTSEQSDLTLVENAPLRLLQNFETKDEWLLEPGDMLYLPPKMAHWGIAVGDCMTYSIGFRAPSTQELVFHFLQYLQENAVHEGIYADPDLEAQIHPAEISNDMVEHVSDMLKNIKWDKQDVANFLGSYLSEPKAHVFFNAPRKTSFNTFQDLLKVHGITLDLKSQALFIKDSFFINGEKFDMPIEHAEALKLLADKRNLDAAYFQNDSLIKPDILNILYIWYQSGYLQIPK